MGLSSQASVHTTRAWYWMRKFKSFLHRRRTQELMRRWMLQPRRALLVCGRREHGGLVRPSKHKQQQQQQQQRAATALPHLRHQHRLLSPQFQVCRLLCPLPQHQLHPHRAHPDTSETSKLLQACPCLQLLLHLRYLRAHQDRRERMDLQLQHQSCGLRRREGSTLLTAMHLHTARAEAPLLGHGLNPLMRTCRSLL